jgi:tRNA(Ile)-lysidine synthase
MSLVVGMAHELNVPCHTGKIAAIPEHGSLEEALRLQRYAFFDDIAATHGYTKIALAHHADDNAETVLMNMLRGSGLQGLAGIPPVRDNRIIRPLIGELRADIVAYAHQHALAYAQDASNADLRFDRNRIRHQLIPLLQKQYNPNLVATLNRTAALCREEALWRDNCLAPLVTRTTIRADAHTLELRLDVLGAQPRAVQRHLLRAALRQWQGHLRRLGADHIDALLDLVTRAGARSLNLPGAVLAQCVANRLCFKKVAAPRGHNTIATAPSYHYSIEDIGRQPLTLSIPEADCSLRFTLDNAADLESWRGPDRQTVLLDMAQLPFPLIVRNWQPGDRFQPFGLQGTQKLQDLFIDRKVTRSRRQRIPLLLCGDTIAWVAGVRRGAAAPVTAATRQVLRVEIESMGESRRHGQNL